MKPTEEERPMPGLLAQDEEEFVSQDGEAPEPEGDEPPADDMEGEQPSNVSPEEQEQYERFVDNCYSMIYDGKVLPKIIQSLDATEDPKMNLANATVIVVKQVAESASKAGTEISGDILMHGGAAVMEDLADLALKVKIHDYTEGEMEGAAYMAMDMYRQMEEKAGTLDVEASKADMRDVLIADQEGRMDELIPGAQGRFGAKKAPPDKEEQPEPEGEDE